MFMTAYNHFVKQASWWSMDATYVHLSQFRMSPLIILVSLSVKRKLVFDREDSLKVTLFCTSSKYYTCIRVHGLCMFVYVCLYLPQRLTCFASHVRAKGCVCVLFTHSGDLLCESCRRGVCVRSVYPIRRLAMRVL